ncbi:hypothetical protein SAMN04487765_3746 [Tenacibaculum sp. MAR_2010_89]|uniref:hypothetical protein n=1 Tax=Tenacibaculum sp. MAR_2010_89 TaxID=1250198 RepID=UPI0008959D3A|nr:hypothetical protein [Tenacibaculum sp. MAR_2010_89]SEE67568.1 hypothetical protein SAMN04487765_3746 [Tenacibaculum sp. MAR_2010_89]
MANEVFKIWESNRCNFVIIDYAPEQRKSFSISGHWSGFVNQFKNGETISEIKECAKKWLRDKLKENFDNQFSSEKQFRWILNELENENQLTFNL